MLSKIFEGRAISNTHFATTLRCLQVAVLNFASLLQFVTLQFASQPLLAVRWAYCWDVQLRRRFYRCPSHNGMLRAAAYKPFTPHPVYKTRGQNLPERRCDRGMWGCRAPC